MARRSKGSSRRSYYRSYPRDPFPITNISMLRVTAVVSPFRQIEDRRYFHPDPVHPVRTLRRAGYILEVPRAPKTNPKKVFARRSTLAHVAFKNPERLLVCIRRKARREVLHALKFSGSGGGRQRRPRYNEHSEIRC